MSADTNGFSELNSSSLNKGHRERLRSKFRKSGADALAEYEMLELILFRSIPRRDTKPLAKRLISVFGSFAEALNAEPARLREMNGIGEATITDFKIVREAANMIVAGKVRERQLFSSSSAVLDYCKAVMAYEEKEQFRILFLDKKNRLIADEVQQTGTVDHTPVYPREVLKRAFELSATALILVHNHPSGDPTPSKADIEMTCTINEIAGSLGIALHDHLIIGRDGHVSMKAQRLF